MSVCLVTGGAGFIGSHLVEALLTAGHEVRVLDNFSTGSLAHLCEVTGNIDLTVGDVANHAVVYSVTNGVEVVFHLAPPVLPGPDETATPFSSPDIGTLNVLRCAHSANVRRVVFASTFRVYSCLPGRDRCSPHVTAKLAAEKMCTLYSTDHNLETVCLRYFNVYGPRQGSPGPDWEGLVSMLHALATNRHPVIRGTGAVPKDVIYVDDAVHATMLAADAPRAAGRVYDIGWGRPTTMLDIVAALHAVSDWRKESIFAANGFADDPPNQADISRAEMDLGFCPCIDLREGLRRCIADYKARQEENQSAAARA